MNEALTDLTKRLYDPNRIIFSFMPLVGPLYALATGISANWKHLDAIREERTAVTEVYRECLKDFYGISVYGGDEPVTLSRHQEDKPFDEGRYHAQRAAFEDRYGPCREFVDRHGYHLFSSLLDELQDAQSSSRPSYREEGHKKEGVHSARGPVYGGRSGVRPLPRHEAEAISEGNQNDEGHDDSYDGSATETISSKPSDLWAYFKEKQEHYKKRRASLGLDDLQYLRSDECLNGMSYEAYRARTSTASNQSSEETKTAATTVLNASPATRDDVRRRSYTNKSAAQFDQKSFLEHFAQFSPVRKAYLKQTLEDITREEAYNQDFSHYRTFLEHSRLRYGDEIMDALEHEFISEVIRYAKDDLPSEQQDVIARAPHPYDALMQFIESQEGPKQAYEVDLFLVNHFKDDIFDVAKEEGSHGFASYQWRLPEWQKGESQEIRSERRKRALVRNYEHIHASRRKLKDVGIDDHKGKLFLWLTSNKADEQRIPSRTLFYGSDGEELDLITRLIKTGRFSISDIAATYELAAPNGE